MNCDRCKDCKWYDSDRYVSCGCPKFVYGYKNLPVDEDGVRVEDDEGWGFTPNPLFGCVHWEGRASE